MTAAVTIRRIDAGNRGTIDTMAANYFREVLPDGPFLSPTALDHYWREAGRYAYLIEADGTPAGFALVWTHRDGTHELAEFTITPPHRHLGIGTQAAMLIFQALGGDWTLGVVHTFSGALPFWETCLGDDPCIHELTRGPAKTEHQVCSLSFRVVR